MKALIKGGLAVAVVGVGAYGAGLYVADHGSHETTTEKSTPRTSIASSIGTSVLFGTTTIAGVTPETTISITMPPTAAPETVAAAPPTAAVSPENPITLPNTGWVCRGKVQLFYVDNASFFPAGYSANLAVSIATGDKQIKSLPTDELKPKTHRDLAHAFAKDVAAFNNIALSNPDKFPPSTDASHPLGIPTQCTDSANGRQYMMGPVLDTLPFTPGPATAA